jgi:hypothetical protein
VTTETKPSEKFIVLLVAAVQFVNILDFMMVMPSGPTSRAAWASTRRTSGS